MMDRLTHLVVISMLIGATSPPARAQWQVETEQLRIEFNAGGEIVRIEACLPGCQDAGARRAAIESAGVAVGFGWTGKTSMSLAPGRRGSAGVYTFEEEFGGQRVEWTVPDQGYRLELRVSRQASLRLHADASFAHNDEAGFASWIGQPRYVLLGADGARVLVPEVSQHVDALDAQWIGFRNRFWGLFAHAPSWSGPLTVAPPDRPALETPLSGPDIALSLYFGPLEPRALETADAQLGELNYAALWAPFRWICTGLYTLLGWIQALAIDWGFSIILLSVAVSILMTPLSRTADRLQQDVQRTEARLAPRIAEIKAAHRGEEQANRILALYRDEGVHPLYSLKSLAGVMVVIPVFIGAFDMLAENPWLSGQSFGWIHDLSHPDSIFPLPFSLGFLGDQFNGLPFLMTGLSVYASYLHHPPGTDPALRARQLRRLSLMALGFLLLFYTFPAGMVLYWTTNNALSVLRSLWRGRRDGIET